MPAALSLWFNQHIYTAVFIATIIEGLGIPLPAEALYIAAGLLVHRGHAHLPVIVLLGAIGNLIGSFAGYWVAYLGGKKLLAKVIATLRLKPEALHEMERFFGRYGSTTIFISRFVGFIRAATIYSSGAARVEPWRFALYTFTAALIWNGAWAFLAFRFGAGLHVLLRGSAWSGTTWMLAAVVIVLAMALLIRWLRRRRPADTQ